MRANSPTPISPERLAIHELKKKLQRAEMENEIQKFYRSLDVGLPEQFLITGKLKARNPVVTLSQEFSKFGINFQTSFTI